MYEVNLWKNTSTPSIWSVPLTVNGTSLEQVATGAYNDHFLKAAQGLAQTKPSADGSIYVRVGWEFNGSWMPWAAEGHEAGFIQSFRHLVDTFRSVSDKFKFVWDVNEGDSWYDPAKAYPGDKYVDVVGMDTYYNTSWDSKDPVAAFQHNVNEKYGLQWQQDFAAAHGKPTAISEWGVNTNNAGAYIQAMTKWMSDHNMVYENYWNSNSDFSGKLSNGQYPALDGVYKSMVNALNAKPSIPTAPTAPDTTAPTISIATVAGDDALNQAERAKTLTIGGTTSGAENGQAVTVLLNGDAYVGTVANNAWKVNVSASDLAGLTDTGGSSYKIAARVADKAGNVSEDAARGLVVDTTADAPRTATLKVNDTADHVINAQEARTVSFSVADLDSDSRAVARFSDGVHTKTVGLAANGSALIDLSGFDGSVTSSLAVTDSRGNQKTIAGNPFKLDTGSHDDTLVFKVSQDAYKGDAKFIVTVDGQQAGDVQTVHALHSKGQWEEITLHGDFADAHDVSVRFINDAYGGAHATRDRNLYVESVNLNGHNFDVSDASMSSHTGVINTAAELWRTGAVDWNVLV